MLGNVASGSMQGDPPMDLSGYVFLVVAASPTLSVWRPLPPNGLMCLVWLDDGVERGCELKRHCAGIGGRPGGAPWFDMGRLAQGNVSGRDELGP